MKKEINADDLYEEQKDQEQYLNEVLEDEKQADIVETMNCLAHEYERGRL